MARIVFLIFAFFSFSGRFFAQTELSPVAKFSSDSAKIGERISLSLTLDYPSPLQVLFPDTNFNFSPFEIIKKDFFPTKTSKGISRDCVVYELSTFSLDTIQTLKMPIYQFTGEDSMGWFSNEARIKIIQNFKGPLPKTPVFQNDLSLINIARKINYPYILIGMAIVLVLILIVNFFFDRPIQKFIFLFLEQRRHNVWLKQFEKNRRLLESNLSVENVEKLLVAWRLYIQRVDGQPYSSFTSTEIFKILPDKKLKEVLQEIDRWIYGGIDMNDWSFNMDYVKQISIGIYLKKRESIRNGKFD